jgi:hypothetical protein
LVSFYPASAISGHDIGLMARAPPAMALILLQSDTVSGTSVFVTAREPGRSIGAQKPTVTDQVPRTVTMPLRNDV